MADTRDRPHRLRSANVGLRSALGASCEYLGGANENHSGDDDEAEPIEFDDAARGVLTESIRNDGILSIIANQRQAGDAAEYTAKESDVRDADPVARRTTSCFSRSMSSTRPLSATYCHFEWPEGNPLRHLLSYLILGRGDSTPVVREIIRQHETDPARRPGIHVG